MRLLLAGATGLVGGHVLAQALADPRIDAVIAPVRRALPAQSKLLAPTVDFAALPEAASWWAADAAISALGTTIGMAGSQGAFRQVDHDYQFAVARLANQHGTPVFVLNSALGADPASRIFYNRVKGELERDLAGLDFASLTFVRPGLIGGERSESRPAERAALALLRILGPVLPRAWRINPARRIAAAMIEAAIAAKPGTHVVSSAELV